MIDLDLVEYLVRVASRSNVEICGYINKSGRVYHLPNRAKDQATSFRVDTADIYRSTKEPRFTWFHSHPVSKAWPSNMDIDFMLQTRKPHLIIGLFPVPVVRLYGFEGRRIVEIQKWFV